jgi:hypothetical protein
MKYKNIYIYLILLIPHYFLAFASLITQTVIIHLSFISLITFSLLARHEHIGINIVVIFSLITTGHQTNHNMRSNDYKEHNKQEHRD